jgi:hypothetical protein
MTADALHRLTAMGLDSAKRELRKQALELEADLRRIRAALRALGDDGEQPAEGPKPAPRTGARGPRPHARSANTLTIRVASTNADRDWDAAEMLKAIYDLGWTTTAKDPDHSIRTVLHKLHTSGKMRRTGTGRYQWAGNGPASPENDADAVVPETTDDESEPVAFEDDPWALTPAGGGYSEEPPF